MQRPKKLFVLLMIKVLSMTSQCTKIPLALKSFVRYKLKLTADIKAYSNFTTIALLQLRKVKTAYYLMKINYLTALYLAKGYLLKISMQKLKCFAVFQADIVIAEVDICFACL